MVKSISTSLLLRGLLAVMVGVVSVAWPGITVGVFVILFAVYAFLAAVTDAMRAFAGDRVGPVIGYPLLAFLSAAAGVIALAWPDITALVLTIWVAAWAFVTGIGEVGMAFRAGAQAGERTMWVLLGLVSVALGVVLAIRPDIGALTLATVFGLFSIVYGVAAIVFGTEIRRAGNASRPLSHAAA